MSKKILCLLLLILPVTTWRLLAQEVPVASEEEEKKEEKKKNTVEEDIEFQLDSLQIAKNNNEFDQMVKVYDELFSSHPFANYRKKLLFQFLVEDIQAESSEFKEYWNNYWDLTVSNFLKDAQGGVTLLAQSLFHEDRKKLYALLLITFVEDGNVFDIARGVHMANILDLDVVEWKRQLKNTAFRARHPEFQSWLVEGEYAKYLTPEDLRALKVLIDKRPKPRATYDVVKGWRPSSEELWHAPTHKLNKPKSQPSTPHDYYYSYNNRTFADALPKFMPNKPQLVHGNLRFAYKKASGIQAVHVVREETGRFVHEHMFYHAKKHDFGSHHAVECVRGSLDIICWSNKGHNKDYTTELLKSDMGGQLLWYKTFKDIFNKEDTYILAGKPQLMHKILLLPVHDITMLNKSSGYYSVALAAIDIDSGSLMWVKSLKDHRTQNYFMQKKNPILMLNKNGVIWIEVDVDELVSIDYATQEIIFRHDFKPKRLKEKREQNGFGMVWGGYYSHRGKEVMDPYKGCLLSSEGRIVYQSGHPRNDVHNTRLLLLDGASGKMLDSYQNTGITFLQSRDSGLMFFVKNQGMIMMSGIKEGKFKKVVNEVPQTLVSPVQQVLPWDDGCLVSNGRLLFQITFNPDSHRVFPQQVMNMKDKRMAVLEGSFYTHDNNRVGKKYLWLNHKRRIQEIWNTQQKSSENFRLVLEIIIRGNSWKELKAFLLTKDIKAYVNKQSYGMLMRRTLNLVMRDQVEEARWLADYLFELNPHHELMVVVRDCLRGMDPQIPDDAYVNIDEELAMGYGALKQLVWSKAGYEMKLNPAYSVKDVRSHRHFLNTDIDRLELKKQVVLPKVVLSKQLNENVYLLEGFEKYYVLNTGKTHNLPGTLLSWSQDHLLVEIKGDLCAFQLSADGTLSKPLWRKPVPQFKVRRSTNFRRVIEKAKPMVRRQQEDIFTVSHGAKQVFSRHFGPYILMQNKTFLSCLDRQTGEVLWTRHFLYRPLLSISEGEGRYLYLYKGNVKEEGRLVKIDFLTGEQVWEVKMLMALPAPIKNVGGSIYVLNKNLWVVIDKKTGAQRTQFHHSPKHFSMHRVQGNKTFVFIDAADPSQCYVMSHEGKPIPLKFVKEKSKPKKEKAEDGDDKEKTEEERRKKEAEMNKVHEIPLVQRQLRRHFFYKDDVVYAISGEERMIYAISAVTGKFISKTPFPDFIAKRFAKVVQIEMFGDDMYFMLQQKANAYNLYHYSKSKRTIKSLDTKELKYFGMENNTTFLTVLDKKHQNAVYFYKKKKK